MTKQEESRFIKRIINVGQMLYTDEIFYSGAEGIAQDIIKDLKEAINYKRCSTELLCVNGDVDGLTTGKYYKELYKDRTHTKLIDDYGIEGLYFNDRFIKPPSKQ